MRTGDDILQNKIGRHLTDGLIQSFIFNKELSDKINVIFLRFDTWLHITTTDETAIHTVKTSEPEQTASWTNEDNSTCEFTLSEIADEYPKFKEYIGRKLVGFKELVSSKDLGITYGIQLQFEEDMALTLFSDKDEMSFITFDNQIPIDLFEK